MRAEYAAKYEDLYTRHWWWRAREEFVVAMLRRLRIGTSNAILDVGCGNGLFFPRLEEFGTVEGIELDGSLISNDNPYRERITIAPFDSKFESQKRYSLILMLDVLEHFEDPVPAVKRAIELLQPRGIIVATVPAFNLLWTAHDEINRHYLRYTKRSFAELAQQAGMHIRSWRYFFHWLWPLKLAVRCKEKLFSAQPGLPRIPPPPINGIFYGLARFEQALLRATPLPFGNSLFVVGSA